MSVPIGDQPIKKLAYKVKDAAKATSISVSALYADIAEGKLLVRKRGKTTLILSRDLEAYLDGFPVGGNV